MRVAILTLNQPNMNGRTYPTETGNSIVQQINNAPTNILGWLAPYNEDVSKASHQVISGSAFVENDTIIVTIQPLDTPSGRILSELMVGMSFRPSGTGLVSADGVVSDYKLTSVDATTDPA